MLYWPGEDTWQGNDRQRHIVHTPFCNRLGKVTKKGSSLAHMETLESHSQRILD